MVPFQLVIVISSESARPYEHDPSPRPIFYLASYKAAHFTFFAFFKFLEKTERAWKNSTHDHKYLQFFKMINEI